jgi:hypothetical protein
MEVDLARHSHAQGREHEGYHSERIKLKLKVGQSSARI